MYIHMTHTHIYICVCVCVLILCICVIIKLCGMSCVMEEMDGYDITHTETHTHVFMCIYTYRFLYTYCTRTHPRAKRCSLKPSSLGTVWEFCCQTRPRFSAVPRTPSCKVFSYNWCKASPRWPQVWLATLCQETPTRDHKGLDSARYG